ncbi:hypothetical protein PVL29_001077 [Vitis rotundifolia]|uniref:Uncharacterized protein n=1 Tax=Vitis rotundifolia TaxID=103349 RepID=A0AA39AKT6_VITRO|nr:hypothetical protein PVL29_001077 [Vitis rotundifolia]
MGFGPLGTSWTLALKTLCRQEGERSVLAAGGGIWIALLWGVVRLLRLVGVRSIPLLTFIVDASVEVAGGVKLLFSLWAVVMRTAIRRKKKRVTEALYGEIEVEVFLVTVAVAVVVLIPSQAMQINQVCESSNRPQKSSSTHI